MTDEKLPITWTHCPDCKKPLPSPEEIEFHDHRLAHEADACTECPKFCWRVVNCNECDSMGHYVSEEELEEAQERGFNQAVSAIYTAHKNLDKKTFAVFLENMYADCQLGGTSNG